MRRPRKPAGVPRLLAEARGPQSPVLTWLASRQNFERSPPSGDAGGSFGLARVRRLLALVGSPQRRLRVVHVAGTKGKGSTVAMLAEILAAAGHRVGRYTSPHVHRLEERICVAGRPIRPRDLATAFEVVIPAVESMDRAATRRGGRGPTWFEAVTVAAFVHFARADVDVVVLETGLGGRLDATNVCDPIVSVITSVSLDHMAILGPTIGRIAAEKAGIIKRGRPVVSGAVHPAARRVIMDTSSRRRAPLLQLDRDFGVVWKSTDGDPLAGGVVTITPPASLGAAPIHATIAMAGRHQADNAALATVAALLLDARGIRVSRRAIIRGLARSWLPARVERVAESPTVVVDAAHNVASMQSLVDAITPLLDTRPRRVLVFAASADKQIEEMIAIAAPRFDQIVVTRYESSRRAASVERIVEACRRAGRPNPCVARTPAEALARARSDAGRSGLVCVAGSFFLAAEIGPGA